MVMNNLAAVVAAVAGNILGYCDTAVSPEEASIRVYFKPFGRADTGIVTWRARPSLRAGEQHFTPGLQQQVDKDLKESSRSESLRMATVFQVLLGFCAVLTALVSLQSAECSSKSGSGLS